MAWENIVYNIFCMDDNYDSLDSINEVSNQVLLIFQQISV